MRVREFAAAEVAHRGGQVARAHREAVPGRLLRVEDHAHVDLLLVAEVERDAVALALDEPQRDVVGDLVEARDVATRQEVDELLSDLLERRAPEQAARVGGVDAGDLGGALADFDAGVDALHERFARAVRVHLHERELDDAVVLGVETRGLEVEEDERAGQGEQHRWTSTGGGATRQQTRVPGRSRRPLTGGRKPGLARGAFWRRPARWQGSRAQEPLRQNDFRRGRGLGRGEGSPRPVDKSKVLACVTRTSS